MFEKEEERVAEWPRGMQRHRKGAEQGTLKPPSFSKCGPGELRSLSVDATDEEPAGSKGCLRNRSKTGSTILLTKSIICWKIKIWMENRRLFLPIRAGELPRE